MPFYFFVWTPEIIAHLAEHDVTSDEFEEVGTNPECEDVSRSTGRQLCCVFKRLGDDLIEPVTAYDVGK